MKNWTVSWDCENSACLYRDEAPDPMEHCDRLSVPDLQVPDRKLCPKCKKAWMKPTFRS